MATNLPACDPESAEEDSIIQQLDDKTALKLTAEDTSQCGDSDSDKDQATDQEADEPLSKTKTKRTKDGSAEISSIRKMLVKMIPKPLRHHRHTKSPSKKAVDELCTEKPIPYIDSDYEQPQDIREAADESCTEQHTGIDSGFMSRMTTVTKPNAPNQWRQSQTFIEEYDTDWELKESPPPIPPRQRINPLQSSHFTEAEKRAKVPFLHHSVLECSSSGQEYTIKDHDITLRIPPGAIPAGEIIRFEIAVAMFGPFTFPSDTQPISPILWLCILDDCVLSKPFQVILPHFLRALRKEELKKHQIVFAKADHTNYLESRNQTEHVSCLERIDRIEYAFKPCDGTPHFATHEKCSYGILLTNHCCFKCLLAKQTPELAMDAGYCLTRVEAFISQERSEIYFVAGYCLHSCFTRFCTSKFIEPYRNTDISSAALGMNCKYLSQIRDQS